MAVIRAVVFSRDRPMQLDALLRSIDRHAPDLYGETIVIFRVNDTYLDAYDTVATEHPDVLFWPERDFASDVQDACCWHGQLVFHCDDDVFYRSPTYIDPCAYPTVCHSLRLGRNTSYCHPLQVEQAVPEQHVWGWPDAEHDFSYPFSLDGHIYRASVVHSLLEWVGPFEGPNDLEHRGVTWMRENPRVVGSYMRGCSQSCVVSIPANRVNDGYPNPASDNPAWQPEALLERYLAGGRIDLEAMDFSNVVGAHQEIPLVFR